MSRFTNEAQRNAVTRVTSVWSSFDGRIAELQHRYPPERRAGADLDAYESRLRDLIRERDSELRTIETEAGRLSVRGEQDHRQAMRADSPPRPDEIANSVARLEPIVAAGGSPEQIAGMPGLTRADVAAARLIWAPRAMAEAGPDAMQSPIFRQRLAEAERAFDDMEVRVIGDPTIRDAVVDERERQRADAALDVVFSYSKQRQANPDVPAPHDIELAFAIGSALGQPAHLPGRKDWAQLVEEAEPLAAAQRERNSLSPELRATLDSNARDAAPHRPSGPIEVSGPEAAGGLR